jgi:outer membrane receptor protein involved in Fe transport
MERSSTVEIDEVIVTAQRREENLQLVPIAVTAADADALQQARVDSLKDINLISPSTNFDTSNNAATSANIRIRGIGTVGNSRAFEGAVGVFIDGVYRTRSGQALQNGLDIDALEVVRGPQGTLFGKNTSAGALLVSSTRPELSALDSNLELSYGNYETVLARGLINVPLGDRAALRVSSLWGQADGFIEDPNGGDYNDRKPRAGKAQLLLEPVDGLSLRLVTDYSEENNNCCYGQIDGVDGPLQPLISALTQARGLRTPSRNFDDYEQVLSNDTQQEVIDKGAVLLVDWEFGTGKSLHSVTALRSWELNQDGLDADSTGANILVVNEAFRTDFFSQEFTLNGTLGSSDYVLGVYFADEDIDSGNQVLFGDQAQTYFDVLLGAQGLPPGFAAAPAGLVTDATFPATSRSYAAFTHWNVQLTEPLKLVIGARYSEEDKTGAHIRSFFTSLPNAAFRIVGSAPSPEYSAKTSDGEISGTLGLQYQFLPQVMGYASYSRGFKAGGVNFDNNGAGSRFNNPAEVPGAIPQDPRFKPEFVDGYEIGFKTTYGNGRVRTNVAAFYDEIEDLQVGQFFISQFRIINAPEATVYGVEIENRFAVTEVLTLDLDAIYLAEAQFGTAAAIQNLSDRRFAQSPDLAMNLALKVDQPLSGDLALIGRAAAVYTGDQFTNTSNNLRRDDQTELNLSIGLKLPSKDMSIVAWCQNCTDERYVTQHFNSPLQAGDTNGYVSTPMTYGVTVRVSF